MAWTAPEVLAASSGCVGRALMGLPSESRTGAPCSGAGAGARCVAGDCMLRPAPGDRTPARDICRRRGGCYALRTLLASSPKFCFRAASGGAARASGLAWGVPRRRRRLRGREGLHAAPENQGQTRRCFFRGRVGWGGAGSRGGGVEHLGRAGAGTRSTTPFCWQKQMRPQKALLFTALRRLASHQDACAVPRASYCASSAREAPRGRRETRAKALRT